MSITDYIGIAACALLVTTSALDYFHRRWFEQKRAEWTASNDALIAALCDQVLARKASCERMAGYVERIEAAAAKIPVVTNSQEGDEVR
jgi:hypothetical protein